MVPNPRKDWVTFYDSKLAIVPIELWKAARRKLAASRRNSPRTGRKMSRNEKSATTLFSGTLICGYCGRELVLIRSADKYKVMGCIHGPHGIHGCKLTSSKSIRIIETCLLAFLQETVLGEKEIERLVKKANAYLAAEAAKPRRDTAPLKASIRDKEASIKKLFQRIEGCEGEALNQAYEKRIAELQKEVNELRLQLRGAEVQNTPQPCPLDLETVKGLLGDLRGLLSQEAPAAAEAIRALTGPIRIRQENVPGRKRGARWIAMFSPDLVRFLAQYTGRRDYPDSVPLEYLSTRIWTKPETVEVPVDHVPKYEQIAPKVRPLAGQGNSVDTISRLMGVPWETVRDAISFAQTGKRPAPRNRKREKKSPRRSKQPPKKALIAAEVARLRDEEQRPFLEIAKLLDASPSTVTRAYDLAHPEILKAAAKKGRTPARGRYCRSAHEVRKQIRQHLEVGQRPAEIARVLGCQPWTVYYERKLMRSEDGQSVAEARRRPSKSRR